MESEAPKKDKLSLSAVILSIVTAVALSVNLALDLWGGDDAAEQQERVGQVEALVKELIRQNPELIDSIPDWFTESEGSSDESVNSN